MKLSQGQVTVHPRRLAQHSLYQHALATYDRGDQFDHDAALGFIALWGLPIKTQAQTQLLTTQSGGQAIAQLTGGTSIAASTTETTPEPAETAAS